MQIEKEEEIDDTMANPHPPQANQSDVQPVNQPTNQQSPTVNQPSQPKRRYPTRQIDDNQPCRFLSWLKPTAKMNYLDYKYICIFSKH